MASDTAFMHMHENAQPNTMSELPSKRRHRYDSSEDRSCAIRPSMASTATADATFIHHEGEDTATFHAPFSVGADESESDCAIAMESSMVMTPSPQNHVQKRLSARNRSLNSKQAASSRIDDASNPFSKRLKEASDEEMSQASSPESEGEDAGPYVPKALPPHLRDCQSKGSQQSILTRLGSDDTVTDDVKTRKSLGIGNNASINSARYASPQTKAALSSPKVQGRVPSQRERTPNGQTLVKTNGVSRTLEGERDHQQSIMAASQRIISATLRQASNCDPARLIEPHFIVAVCRDTISALTQAIESEKTKRMSTVSALSQASVDSMASVGSLTSASSAFAAAATTQCSAVVESIKIPLFWWPSIIAREQSSFIFFATLTHGADVHATRVKHVHGKDDAEFLVFEDPMEFRDLPSDFAIDIKLYCYKYINVDDDTCPSTPSTPRKESKVKRSTPRVIGRFLKDKFASGGSHNSSRCDEQEPDNAVLREGFILVAKSTITLAEMRDGHECTLDIIKEHDPPLGEFLVFQATLSEPASSEAAVVHEGHLTVWEQDKKQTSGTWSRRYCRLKGMKLLCFKDHKSTQPMSEVSLVAFAHGAEVHKLPRQQCARPNCFSIQCKDADGKVTNIVKFAGDDKETRLTWMRVFKACIADYNSWHDKA